MLPSGYQAKDKSKESKYDVQFIDVEVEVVNVSIF